MSHCKELPQSTVGFVSFAAGMSYLYISVTDFCCMIQINDNDDDGYINVDNNITFLYETEHCFSFFKKPHPSLSCFSCSYMVDCDTVSGGSKLHPFFTNEAVQHSHTLDMNSKALEVCILCAVMQVNDAYNVLTLTFLVNKSL